MDWSQIILLMMGLVLVLLLGGVWIGIVLGATGSILLLLNGYSLDPIATIFWTQSSQFVLVAVPLFIFMGEIILTSGISAKFYRSIAPSSRVLPGGLYSVNILSAGIFSAVCGSSVATAAAVGKVAIPELRARNCNDKLSFGSIAAGGTLGILIPPSTALILYGSIVNVNIATLFIAGIVPGLMLIGMFLVWVSISKIWVDNRTPNDTADAPAQSMLDTLRGVGPISVLIILIIGGIYAGYVTPSEASALGVAGAIAVGKISGNLSLRTFWIAAKNSVTTTAMIIFIVLGAQILSYALARTGASRELVEFVIGSDLEAWQIFAVIALIYLILGCFIDAISIMMLTLPLFFPIVVALGFDPIWFGIVLMMLIEVGLITPPLGLNLFVIQNVVGGRDSFRAVAIGSLPFVFILVFGVIILYLFPQIALFL